MAESMMPEVIPGYVTIKYVGSDDKDSGEKKGFVKNVFPVDAREMIATGKYELVDNGAVEAARLNANPLQSTHSNPALIVSEVVGVAGQVHVAVDEKAADAAKAAGDHKGEEVPAPVAVPAKAPGTPTGAKSDADKK